MNQAVPLYDPFSATTTSLSAGESGWRMNSLLRMEVIASVATSTPR